MRKIRDAYVPTIADRNKAIELSRYPSFPPRVADVSLPPPTPMRCDDVAVKEMPLVNNGYIPVLAMCQSGWINLPAFHDVQLRLITVGVAGGIRLSGSADVSIV